MRLEDIEGVIMENVPELLNIGDYRGRVEKCIEVLRSTHTEYDKYYITQESDDIVNMLDTFLVEDEAYGFMKEHNYEAFYKTSQIIDMCKTCLYENRHWRTIPIQYTCFARNGHKISVLGIYIGYSKQQVITELNRHNLLYEVLEKQSIKLGNKLSNNDGSVRFDLQIDLDTDRVKRFILSSSIDSKKWSTLAYVDTFLGNCAYKLDKCNKDSIVQIYSTYYDVAVVTQDVNGVRLEIVSAKEYNNSSFKLWKR